MENDWEIIFDGFVQGRPVKIERHLEGDYKATTTSANDYPGNVVEGDSQTAIFPPAGSGDEICLESGSLQEICNWFLEEGFFEADVQRIRNDLN